MISKALAQAGPAPVLTLDATTTLDDVVAYLDARAEHDRKVRFYSAKTNLGRLIATGVVNCDDGFGEMVRAYAYERDRATAIERYGPDFTEAQLAEARHERETAAARADARDFLWGIVLQGETPAEYAARWEAAIPGGRHPSGRVCRHHLKHVTIYERHAAHDADHWVWRCSACGASASWTSLPETRSPASDIALRLMGAQDIEARLQRMHAFRDSRVATLHTLCIHLGISPTPADIVAAGTAHTTAPDWKVP